MKAIHGKAILFGLSAFLLLPACGGGSSGSGSGGASASTGGNTVGTGGATPGTGGAAAGTGGTPAASGGNSGGGTGGAKATGGTPGSGGSDVTGGASGNGGTKGAGGMTGGAGSSGAGSITGTYNTTAILPIMSGIWIGKPQMASETGGGPFIYLFSGPITCAQISAKSGWLPTIPAGTQVLELLVGTTMTGTPVTVDANGAGAGRLEANYATGMQLGEHGAKAGSTVTLTSYKAGMSVEGTVDLQFPVGSAKGSFHADYCAAGQEI